MSDRLYDTLKFISLLIIPLANFLAKCGEACGVAELSTVSTILIAADVLFGAVVTAANEVYKRGEAEHGRPGWSVMQNEQNHFPKWVRTNSAQRVIELLNMDDRVIGMEIRNTSSLPIIGAGDDTEDNENVNSVKLWDEILLTGKRCWGFCVPDHETEWGNRWTGRNILLIDSFDEHTCLKAYRNGNFYSKIFNSNLSFNNISYNDNTNEFSVSAPLAETIHIIIDGTDNSFNNNNINTIIPPNTTFIRAEAWMPYTWYDRNGRSHEVIEKIYSNPIIFKEYKGKNQNINEYNKKVLIYD